MHGGVTGKAREGIPMSIKNEHRRYCLYKKGSYLRMKELKKLYRKKKAGIDSRLNEFRKTGNSSQKRIFAEMCFCILTPQSRAVTADSSIKQLVSKKILYEGTKLQIRRYLKGVRFPNNKAGYIIKTRKEFTIDGKLIIKEILDGESIINIRETLMKKVTGYGLKEASHFLRNIGLGSDIAILDRHIQKELKKYNVIKVIPDVLTRKKYIYIEEEMRKFSKNINIPMDALDLLFWYKETGYFFK